MRLFKSYFFCCLMTLVSIAPCFASGMDGASHEMTEADPNGTASAEKAEDQAGPEYPRVHMQHYLTNLSFHEPMYLLVGTEPENSKLQLSFKYRLFNPEKGLSRQYPWISGLHLGYTQTSLWDLESMSKPFVDTSYKPELFFLSDNIKARPSRLNAWIIQTGYRHESNGQGGTDSRSTNCLYFKTGVSCDLAGGCRFGMAPQVWVFFKNDDKTNPDIEDYRGFFEIEAGITRPDSFALISAFQERSVRVDFSYPLSRLFADNMDFYFYAQYFAGYAETLKNYRQKDEATRFGIAITR